MADEKPYPGVRSFALTEFNLASTSSVATATVAFGGDIWKSATLPNQPPPDHPIYALIGQVAAGWARLDHTLDILIWELADVDAQAGACITAQIPGTYGRFKAVIALLAFHQQRTNRDLKSLIAKATELSQRANGPGEQRHRTIHDPWYDYRSAVDQAAQFRAMPHKTHQYGIHPVDLKAVESDLEEIKKFEERVASFRTDVKTKLVTSPRIHPLPFGGSSLHLVP